MGFFERIVLFCGVGDIRSPIPDFHLRIILCAKTETKVFRGNRRAKVLKSAKENRQVKRFTVAIMNFFCLEYFKVKESRVVIIKSTKEICSVGH